MFIAKSITTRIYYGKFHSEQKWYKENISFEDYKKSVKRHLGNTNFNRDTNKYKHKIKQYINKSENIEELKQAFYGTGIKIEVKVYQ